VLLYFLQPCSGRRSDDLVLLDQVGVLLDLVASRRRPTPSSPSTLTTIHS
jgi:hypothetical protein